MTPAAHERGAVIVEALVAVLIIAAMAGLWFQTLAQAARQQQALADRQLAMLIAQSQLATVGIVNPLGRGVVRGSEAGFEWSISVEPFSEAGEGIEKVNVTAGRPDGPALASLQSLRLQALRSGR